ncbi:MAG: hypothetical protein ACRD00_04280 [Thermoanaerobaculia bacterium]
MTIVSLDAAIEQVVAVLAEALDGPKQSWSYFTDQGAEAGLFGTLARLSAADASRVWGGTTIAAHAHHIQFGLAASAAWIAGDRTSRDWQESWSVSTVDDAAWKRLREQLRGAYDDLRRAIESHASSGVEAMGGAVGAVAHAAYHLGAIRQKVVAARSAAVSEAIAKRGWTRDELHERHPKD